MRATSRPICSRFRRRRVIPTLSFMDDANLKEKGRVLIKQYGCAGCHEIKGFEEEQRIGKELTVKVRRRLSVSTLRFLLTMPKKGMIR